MLRRPDPGATPADPTPVKRGISPPQKGALAVRALLPYAPPVDLKLEQKEAGFGTKTTAHDVGSAQVTRSL